MVEALGEAVVVGVQAICGVAGCEVVELNVQQDHVHIVAIVPPKVSISDLMGRVKGPDSDEGVPAVSSIIRIPDLRSSNLNRKNLRG